LGDFDAFDLVKDVDGGVGRHGLLGSLRVMVDLRLREVAHHGLHLVPHPVVDLEPWTRYGVVGPFL